MNTAETKQERADLIYKQRAIINRMEKDGRKTMNTEEKAEMRNLDTAINELEDILATLKALENKEADLDDVDDEQVASRDDDTKEADLDDADQEEDKRKRGHRSAFEALERNKKPQAMWESRAIGGDREPEFANFDDRQLYENRAFRKSKKYNNAYRNAVLSRFGVPNYREGIAIGTGAGGGNLALPVELSEKFVYNLNNYSYMRQVATVESLKQAISLGVRQYLTIPQAVWSGETAQLSIDGNSTFGQRELSPNLLSLMDGISLRTLQAVSDAEKWVTNRSQYAVAWGAEQAFMTGSGTGQPMGIFTNTGSGCIPTSQDITASVSLANCFTGDDVINTYYSLPQQYTERPSFGVFVHRGAMAYIRTLKTSTGQYLLEPGLAANRPDTLIGAKVFMSEAAPPFSSASPTASQYVLCYGAFEFYEIAEVVDAGSQDAPSMQILFERFADNNLRAYIFRYWVDGQPTLNAAYARLKLQAS